MYNANTPSLNSIWKYNFDNLYSISILTVAYIYVDIIVNIKNITIYVYHYVIKDQNGSLSLSFAQSHASVSLLQKNVHILSKLFKIQDLNKQLST